MIDIAISLFLFSGIVVAWLFTIAACGFIVAAVVFLVARAIEWAFDRICEAL